MTQTAILAGLFLTAFAAATLFPAQSETVLSALIVQNNFPLWLLITVASVGNVLGSCVNWGFGRYLESFKNKTWFPFKEGALEKAQARYRKYGRWSLLLSWVPFIGDPITVVAGVMKEKFPVFLLFVTLAKTGRYLILAYIVSYGFAGR